MAVVVDLDAARGAGKAEAFGDAVEEGALGRAFGKAAAKRLAGVLAGVLDEGRLVAALRDFDADLAGGLGRKRLGEQFARLRLVGEQDEARDGLVVVELRDEAFEDLLGAEGAVGLREIGAVAPVLAGAEEEYLDAGLAAFLVGGEDVGLLDRLGVDRLFRCHVGERPEAVPVFGGLLVLELFGGLLHQALVHAAHVLAFAAQEALGLVDEALVVLLRDLARAGAGAALDLVEQAGAGAALEDAVGTGAQEEGALEHVDRAVDGAGGGEGAEIVALLVARAAVLEDLGGVVGVGDQDVGERLVVAHQDIETRTEALDEIGFEEKGLGLGADADEFHRGGERDHARDAVRMTAEAGIVRDTGLERAGLADVDDITLGVEHAVDAGGGGQCLQIAGDDRGARFRRGNGFGARVTGDFAVGSVFNGRLV